MESRTSSFEDHMNIVESGHSKVASKSDETSVLDKLAAELGFGETEKKAADSVTAPGAPTAEGEVHPADASVAGASGAVVAATEAVATPQTAIAGGNPEEAAAGEVAAVAKPNEGVAISAGDGKVLDANNLHKTPESVAAAASMAGGDEGSAPTPAPEKAGQMPGQEKMAEAQEIGKMIADSFQDEIAKQAEAQEYTEALDILKEAELLEDYKINDEGMNKEASYPEGCLEKISQKQPLSRQEIVGAAVEFVGLQKEAEFAEEQGREDARNLVNLVSEMQKTAEDEDAPAEEKPAEEKADKAKPAEGEEKVAALLKDESVVGAVKLLKEKGLL